MLCHQRFEQSTARRSAIDSYFYQYPTTWPYLPTPTNAFCRCQLPVSSTFYAIHQPRHSANHFYLSQLVSHVCCLIVYLPFPLFHKYYRSTLSGSNTDQASSSHTHTCNVPTNDPCVCIVYNMPRRSHYILIGG